MVTRIGPKNPLRMRIFLREWRESDRIKAGGGLTLEEVAGRIGTTKSTVQRMESSTREPNLGYLAAFAEALQIELADIFRHPDRPTPEELRRQEAERQLHETLRVIQGDRKTGTDS